MKTVARVSDRIQQLVILLIRRKVCDLHEFGKELLWWSLERISIWPESCGIERFSWTKVSEVRDPIEEVSFKSGTWQLKLGDLWRICCRSSQALAQVAMSALGDDLHLKSSCGPLRYLLKSNSCQFGHDVGLCVRSWSWSLYTNLICWSLNAGCNASICLLAPVDLSSFWCAKNGERRLASQFWYPFLWATSTSRKLDDLCMQRNCTTTPAKFGWSGGKMSTSGLSLGFHCVCSWGPALSFLCSSSVHVTTLNTS